jgi:4-hydroxy-2-oxoheptanedioate aldolase
MVAWPTGAQAPKPTRINRVVELLQADQPVYYTGSHSGTAGTFEQGKADAQTFADYLSYDMEHAPFDVKGLAEYMKGLAAAGPGEEHHRTPAVIVNVPVNGTDEATVRANAWMFHRCWPPACTASCCAMPIRRAPFAFVEAVRLPIPNRVSARTQRGRRGAHGSPTAAQIWHLLPRSNQKADVWPLNPNGELVLGLKLEDKYALANAEANLEVPGIAFAEGLETCRSLLGIRGPNAQQDPANARRARQNLCGDQSQQDLLSGGDEPGEHHREDQGRRPRRAGQPGGHRDRAQVHQAGDALVADVDLVAQGFSPALSGSAGL